MAKVEVKAEGRLHALGPWVRVSATVSDLLRWGRRDRQAGPFLITGVASGLALDTGQQGQGCRVASGLPHSLSHQLWHMRPTGVKGEVSIVSAANELAMDATPATSDGIQPLMSRPNGEPWQRWRLKPSADGKGFLIESPRTGNCLTLTEGARENLDEQWAPWLSEQRGGPDQKWIISLPDGSTWGGPA